MDTLEELLKTRLAGGDARAQIGAIEDSRGAIRLMFGALGCLPAIVLDVAGNAVTMIAPKETDMAVVKTRDDEGKAQHATRVDSAALTEQPNPPPAENTLATVADANAHGGANGVEGESRTGNAPAAKPAFVGKNDHNKDVLLTMAATVGAIVEPGWTKAEIAQAINEKTGAVPPAE